MPVNSKQKYLSVKLPERDLSKIWLLTIFLVCSPDSMAKLIRSRGGRHYRCVCGYNNGREHKQGAGERKTT